MKGHKPPRFRSSKQRRRDHPDLGKGRKSDITPKTPGEPPLGRDGPPTPGLKFNSTDPCPKSAAVICIDCALQASWIGRCRARSQRRRCRASVAAGAGPVVWHPRRRPSAYVDVPIPSIAVTCSVVRCWQRWRVAQRRAVTFRVGRRDR